jgi:hypothetical protein
MIDRADETLCKVIHSFSTTIENNTSYRLGILLKRIASAHSTNIPSNATILDISGLLVEKHPGLRLYTLWVCPVSTPAVFSMSCVCEHVRQHLRAGAMMIVTVFNDLGGEEGDVIAGPGTYLVGLKKIDEQQRCVPVNFSRQEKAAIKQQRDSTNPSSEQDVGEEK